ncbi:MAG TPA: LppX_LprAFG lipoprotein [Candidatus Limnocylindrales bacterium]|nr:LppX_LprAFG lipoprotein [Candidatus Limnocylindrales bacterium]
MRHEHLRYLTRRDSGMMVPMAIRPRYVWLLLVLVATLAACGGTTSSPVDSEAAPSPAALTDSPATQVPPSSSAPSLPADAGGPYAEALVAALGAEDLVTHIEQSAKVTTSVAPDTEITADLVGDISGDDLAMVIELSAPGVTQASELVVVGDTAYTRVDGEDWISAPRAAIAESVAGLLDNLRVVEDPNQLRYVGLADFEGRQLHHLVAATQVPYTPSTGGTGHFETLDVWIEDDGTPVSLRGDFSAIDAAGNRGEGTSEMRFSRFGEPVEIEAPDLGESAAPSGG